MHKSKYLQKSKAEKYRDQNIVRAEHMVPTICCVTEKQMHVGQMVVVGSES